MFPSLLGIAGIALFVGLGVWQVQRLEWKEAVLSSITARINSAPVSLPSDPSSEAHNFLPVYATGRTVGGELLVLLSRKGFGPGFRSITAFETEGRRVLLDGGFVPDAHRREDRPNRQVDVVGNLHWPKEYDSWFTPEPEGNLWFARRVPEMAAELDTEPVLVVARLIDPPADNVFPWGVDEVDIPNNHLQYAITWFGLAASWAGMTAFWLWRISRRPIEREPRTA